MQPDLLFAPMWTITNEIFTVIVLENTNIGSIIFVVTFTAVATVMSVP